MNSKEKIVGEYEVIFITKKGDKEEVKVLSEKVKSIENLRNFNIELWKEMKPAYRIRDIEESEYGLYFLMKFECEKQNLKLANDILKSSLLVKRYRILNTKKNTKKMKVGRIQNPKPRIRRKPSNFTNDRKNYKNRMQESSSSNKE